MSLTPRLNLPFLAAGQAQKHVTLNDSLLRLDALVQIQATSRAVTAPPASPAEGACYLVPALATGAWAGHAGKLACFQDGGWTLFAPLEGWQVWIADEALFLVHHNAQWVPAPVSTEQVARWGVNGSADDQNRLTVAGAGALFTHAGGDHRLTINKAAVGNTASLVFQSGYSGRAEIGLAGGNGLSVKHSDDGATWTDIFQIESSVRTWLSGHAFEVVPSTPYGLIRIAASIAGERYSVLDLQSSASHPIYSARLIRYPGANGALSFLNVGTGEFRLGSQDSGPILMTIASIDRMRLDTAGNLTPELDNAYALGKAGARFSAIWAANGVIQTSDVRDKEVARPFAAETACALIEAVDPVLFRWKTGSREIHELGLTETSTNIEGPALDRPKRECTIVERPGQRLHAGFRAQDIKAALDQTGLDFGAWGLEDPADADSRQWLRPDQLIPVLWAALKETRAQLSEIKRQLEKASRA